MATPTLIVIFQRGAMDGLNALVPWADDHYYDLRPSIALPPPGETDGVIDLDGYFGLNPALQPLKALYDAGELAAVHATGATIADRSHFSAQLRMEVGGTTQSGASGGWLGRHLRQRAQTRNRAVRAISIGVALDQSLAGEPSAIAVPDSASFRLSSGYAQIWEGVLPMLNDSVGFSYEDRSQRALTALDLFAQARPHEIATLAEATYPAGGYGTALAQAAQYIKADIGIEAITINIGGWDHHAAENTVLPPALSELSSGMAALRTDLGERFDDVVVVTMSEFGRRAAQNAAMGTDHGRGNAMFVMGGRVNGGQVISDWPTLAPDRLDDGDLRITIDYRTVLAEILRRGFGSTDLGRVFPAFGDFRSLNLMR